MSGIGASGAGGVRPNIQLTQTERKAAAAVAGAAAGAIVGLPVAGAIAGVAAEIATESTLSINKPAASKTPANVVSFVDSTEKAGAKAPSAGASALKGAADQIGDAAHIAEEAIKRVAQDVLKALKGN